MLLNACIPSIAKWLQSIKFTRACSICTVAFHVSVLRPLSCPRHANRLYSHHQTPSRANRATAVSRLAHADTNKNADGETNALATIIAYRDRRRGCRPCTECPSWQRAPSLQWRPRWPRGRKWAVSIHGIGGKSLQGETTVLKHAVIAVAVVCAGILDVHTGGSARGDQDRSERCKGELHRLRATSPAWYLGALWKSVRRRGCRKPTGFI